VLAPHAWARLYELGVRRGRPGQFYLALAALDLARSALSTRLSNQC
jgi:hypothetical protein